MWTDIDVFDREIILGKRCQISAMWNRNREHDCDIKLVIYNEPVADMWDDDPLSPSSAQFVCIQLIY